MTLEERVARIEETLDAAFHNEYEDAMSQLLDAFHVWNRKSNGRQWGWETPRS